MCKDKCICSLLSIAERKTLQKLIDDKRSLINAVQKFNRTRKPALRL